MGEPLTSKAAKVRIREVLSKGKIVYSKPHALQRLNERNLTMLDCENVLRGGSVSEPYEESGNWRYRVKTQNIEVVVQFLPYNQLLVVTMWRIGGRR